LNSQQSDKQPPYFDSSVVHRPRNVFRGSNAHQSNFSKHKPYPKTNFNDHGDDMFQSDSFHSDEMNGHYNSFDRDPIRPRFPHPNMPVRNRFRPPGPNLAMRGPRPYRMFRPPGYPQRPRFRPPRPRMPQGFMPRRPIFWCIVNCSIASERLFFPVKFSWGRLPPERVGKSVRNGEFWSFFLPCFCLKVEFSKWWLDLVRVIRTIRKSYSIELLSFCCYFLSHTVNSTGNSTSPLLPLGKKQVLNFPMA